MLVLVPHSPLSVRPYHLLKDFVVSDAASPSVCVPPSATLVDHAALRDVAEDLLDALVVPSAFRPNG